MYGVFYNILLSSQDIISYIVLGVLFIPLFVSFLALRSAPNFDKDKLSLYPIFAIGISFILSSILFLNIIVYGKPLIIEGPLWFHIGTFNVYWSFLIDTLSCVMLIVITFISLMVHIFSVGYMSHDYNLPKFMGYLSVFTFFMMMLVTAGNMTQMFFAWEGVGLLSFLLINFWYTRTNANKSAVKAVLVNKFGDFSFIIAICALGFIYGTFDIYSILNFSLNSDIIHLIDPLVIFGYDNITLDLCCLALLFAAFAKSAQVPFHTWLPDAMEGPTPVSALLHAATMVTAGVFLVCRFSPLFQYSQFSLWLCTIIGALTAIFAASCGFFQNDIKRIVALSTCSQIGYMFFICGLSGFNIAMFHLFTHAFFKASLFLCCGAVIHAVNDEQDIRRMGGLFAFLPLSCACMIISSLSLGGFPFLAGYYSKDAILEFAYASNDSLGLFAFIIGNIAAFFTALYSFRLIYLVFITRPNTPRETLFHAHDAPLIMIIPIIILTFCSIFVGYLFRDMFIGSGTDFWGTLIPLYNQSSNILFAEYIPSYIKLTPTFAALSGAILSYPLFNFYKKFSFTFFGRRIYAALNNRWYFDHIYSFFLIKPTLHLSFNVLSSNIDQGILDNKFIKGLIRFLDNLSRNISRLDSGYIRHYIIIYLLGLLILISSWSISIYFNYNLDIQTFVVLLCVIYTIDKDNIIDKFNSFVNNVN